MAGRSSGVGGIVHRGRTREGARDLGGRGGAHTEQHGFNARELGVEGVELFGDFWEFLLELQLDCGLYDRSHFGADQRDGFVTSQAG